MSEDKYNLVEEPNGKWLNKNTGVSYANYGVALYWAKVQAGDVTHSPAKKPRAPLPYTGSKPVAVRYYERTGRHIDEDMELELTMVNQMYQAAGKLPKDERFAALKDCAAAMSRYNKNWAPYLERRLPAMQPEEIKEETMTIEQILQDDTNENS